MKTILNDALETLRLAETAKVLASMIEEGSMVTGYRNGEAFRNRFLLERTREVVIAQASFEWARDYYHRVITPRSAARHYVI